MAKNEKRDPATVAEVDEALTAIESQFKNPRSLGYEDF